MPDPTEPLEPQSPPPEPQPPEAPDNPIAHALRARGYQLGAEYTDDDFLQELNGLSQNLPPQEELEQFRKTRPLLTDYAANAAEYQQWKAQQAVAQRKQQQQRETEDEPSWSVPTMSETAQRLISSGVIETDPKSGVYVSDNPAFAQFVHEANQTLRWRADAGSKLVTDPWGTVLQAGGKRELAKLRAELREELKQELLGELSQRDSRREIDGIYARLQKDLFHEVGGQMVATEKGKAFEAAYNDALYLAGVDPNGQVPADVQVRAAQYAARQAEAFKPRPPKEDAKGSFLRRAKANGRQNRVFNQGGSQISAAARKAAQNPDASFMDLIEQTQAEMA